MSLRIFQSVTIGRKLLAISIVFLAPIALLLYYAVSTNNGHIRFGQLEVMGERVSTALGTPAPAPGDAPTAGAAQPRRGHDARRAAP